MAPAIGKKVLAKRLVPETGSLFGAVKALAELANEFGAIGARNLFCGWLSDEQIFVDIGTGKSVRFVGVRVVDLESLKS